MCEVMKKKPDLSLYLESANYIKEKIGAIPEIALILGSGLGEIAQTVESPVIIPYENIPNFPQTTLPYHKGELVYGTLNGKNVLVMRGRFHVYEGYEMWETAYPVAVMKLLGIRRLIITNAAGGISENTRIGDLVCVRDHIKLAQGSPDTGANIPAFGDRFFDMQTVYDAGMRALARRKGEEMGIDIKEGVYAYMTGPQYETPAEINMLRLLGATLVGMSTVPEVIEAAHCKIPVLCISCVANKAAGTSGASITERDVYDTGRIVAGKFGALLTSIVGAL